MRPVKNHLRCTLTMVFVVAVGVAHSQEAATEAGPVVITGTQATFSIAMALSTGTDIRIVNIPDDGREFALLKPYLDLRKDRFAPLFASATAVISLTNALPGDPLYRFARASNVRIVNIDAAVPWTYDAPGVSLIEAPHSDVDWAQPVSRDSQNETSPFFWLSISNTIRMADIIASDFRELFPEFEANIAANLDRFKRAVLEMRRTYQDRLLSAANDTVFALTGDFAYLTNDLGLFVDGYFIQQDVNWTPADLTALTTYLDERDIRVVIHKWEPAEAIQAAIRAGGAQLVVLETGDQGRIAGDVLAADGLQQILADNLEKITAALSQ
jgi:ABC-type Zn uptake system ZnuABC Zn-binding protein ZnuA